MSGDHVEVDPDALRASADGIRSTGTGFRSLQRRLESVTGRWVTSSDPSRASFGMSIAPMVQQLDDALKGLERFCEGTADAVVVAADNYTRTMEGNAQRVAGVAAEEAEVQPGEAPKEGVHARSADRVATGDGEVRHESQQVASSVTPTVWSEDRAATGDREARHESRVASSVGGSTGTVSSPTTLRRADGSVISEDELKNYSGPAYAAVTSTVERAPLRNPGGSGVSGEALAWVRSTPGAEFGALRAQAEAERAAAEESYPRHAYAARRAVALPLQRAENPQQQAEITQQRAEFFEQQQREFEASRPDELARIAAERDQAVQEAVATRSGAEVWRARAEATEFVAQQAQERADAEQSQAGAGQAQSEARVWAQRAQDIDVVAQQAQERAAAKDAWAADEAESAQLQFRNLEFQGRAVENIAEQSRAAAERARDGDVYVERQARVHQGPDRLASSTDGAGGNEDVKYEQVHLQSKDYVRDPDGEWRPVAHPKAVGVSEGVEVAQARAVADARQSADAQQAAQAQAQAQAQVEHDRAEAQVERERSEGQQTRDEDVKHEQVHLQSRPVMLQSEDHVQDPDGNWEPVTRNQDSVLTGSAHGEIHGVVAGLGGASGTAVAYGVSEGYVDGLARTDAAAQQAEQEQRAAQAHAEQVPSDAEAQRAAEEAQRAAEARAAEARAADEAR